MLKYESFILNILNIFKPNIPRERILAMLQIRKFSTKVNYMNKICRLNANYDIERSKYRNGDYG